MASIMGSDWELRSAMLLRESLRVPGTSLVATLLVSAEQFGASPTSLVVSRHGNIWAVLQNHVLAKVSQTGVVTIVAGKKDCVGYKDGYMKDARFSFGYWLSGIVEQLSGDIVFTDPMNHVIRYLRSDETEIGTIAGSGGNPGHCDGPVPNSRFNLPGCLVLGNDGSLFVSDTESGSIRRICNGSVTTVYNAFGGAAGDLHFPSGLAYSPKGQLVVSDSIGHSLCRVAQDRTTIITGSTNGFRDGAVDEARLSSPIGLSMTHAGDILICDSGNHAIRALIDGQMSTVFAPSDVPKLQPQRAGTQIAALWPRAISLGFDGQIFVADLQGIVAITGPPQFTAPLPEEMIREQARHPSQIIQELVSSCLVPLIINISATPKVSSSDLIRIARNTSLLLSYCALVVSSDTIPDTSMELIKHTLAVLNELVTNAFIPNIPQSSILGILNRLKECYEMFPTFFSPIPSFVKI